MPEEDLELLVDICLAHIKNLEKILCRLGDRIHLPVFYLVL